MASTNYRITENDKVAAGGAKTKAKQNIAAIRLLKEIEAIPRTATKEEQEKLALYTGWGPAPDIFTTKKEWVKLQDELKELLTDEEFESARSSTLNAHYTDPAIVSEIYAGLKKLGFDGGRILDPSMGASGMFEGVMPETMTQSSEITGVELDSISGRVATQLYPESTIHVSAFQEVALPDDYFDLTVSNVPFSEIGVADPDYKGLPVNTLHDYFFAKGLDKVRPGGLLAYITSTGTMQSARGEKFRQHLSEQANLVGAIRLPGSAFKQIAGTEVTTDLIILQKLGNEVEPDGKSWSKLQPTSVVDAEGVPLKTNEYFVQNPQMMLGELADDKLHPGRLAMRSDGRAIDQAIREAFEHLPEDIYQPRLEFEAEEEQILIPPDLQRNVKQSAFTLHEDQLMVRDGNWLYPVELTGKKLERALGLIEVRDATERVLNTQLENQSDQAISLAQADLNRVYDGFVKANGPISRRANKNVFEGDPSYPLLLALENFDKESQTATKTDIFNKRTIQPHVAKDSAETAQEALLYSLNEYGKVNIDRIAELVGSNRIEVSTELQESGLIYRDPANNQWQAKDEYLSGNVKQKLAEAVASAREDFQFSVNVEALEAVQPDPIPPGDIDVKLGATWIPTQDLEVFVGELLDTTADKINIRYTKESNSWYVGARSEVAYSAANTEIHGSGRKSALELISLGLNLKTPVIYDYDSRDGSRTLNVDETAAAKLKFETIRERFKEWLWVDPERTDRLTNLYNDRFNTHVERQFNGEHLEFPGMNSQITLRPHQKNAVWQALNGNTMFAHAVGAGKTFSMIASAVEQKRLGLAQKPMLVVPNHLLEQIAGDCKQLYPAANVLAATKKDSSKKNRQELMSRIATGDWDIVLVTHSAFEKLRMSDQARADFYQESVDEIKEAIGGIDANDEVSRRAMKDLEKKKESLKNKIKEIADNPTKDNAVTFEQLGVDCLVVDESHYFKNLGYTTKMTDVAGLPNTNSGRAFDMFMKSRYISQIRGEGKGLIFATGTPITNSIAELYTVQRYLQPEVLREAGIGGFDEWASTFGDTVTTPELSTTGEFKVKTRFTRFVNLPELRALAGQVMDVQTQDMLNLPIPEIAGGKPTVVAVPATDEQLTYMSQLVERSKNLSSVDRTEDNGLKIAGDGRKMSAAMQLIDPSIPLNPDSKLNRLVDDIAAYWDQHGEEKTHLIFCELGTPKTSGLFPVYEYIKKQSIEAGVPAEKIAFAQDANSDAQKLALQKDFNSGKVAVLISGASLETGFNGQRRLGRISHFTVPWRPDQIEQRDGRGRRQGNQNQTVEILRYTTQGRNGQIGFDGYLWQTLGRKQKFVDQFMKGSTALRKMDDISVDVMSYSELEGISTGNPLIMEKATVDNTVAQLVAQKRAHTNSLYRKRQVLSSLPVRIKTTELLLTDLKGDLKLAQAALKTGKVTLWNTELDISNAEEIGKSIRSRAAILNKAKEGTTEHIGKLSDLHLYIQKSFLSTALLIEGNRQYKTDGIVQSKQGAYEALTGIESLIQGSIKRNFALLAGSRNDLASMSKQADQPFSKEEELQTALTRQAEIYVALDSIGKKTVPIKKIAAEGKQANVLTRRIARFLEHTNLQKEVTAADGFKVTLQEVETQVPVTIDAREGTSLTIQSEVPRSTLGEGKSVTATFSIDGKGLLEEIEELGVDQAQSQSKDSVQLGYYLARNVFELVIQAPDESIEVESSDSRNSNVENVPSGENIEAEETTTPIVSSENIERPSAHQSVIDEPVKAQQEERIAPTPLDKRHTDIKGEDRLEGSSPQTEPASVVSESQDTTSIGKTDRSEPSLEEQTSLPVAVEKIDEPTVEPTNQTELGTGHKSGNRQAEPVVLVLTSLSSGETTKIVLPSDPDLTSKNHTSLVEKKSEASETNAAMLYESAAITVTRNQNVAGIEVRFAEKPITEWTDKLRAQGFRFSSKGKDPRWWKKEAKVSVPEITKLAKEYTASVIKPEKNSEEVSDAAPSAEESTTPKRSSNSEPSSDNIRPTVRIYLDLKATRPDSIALVRNSLGFHETFMDDAVIASRKLGTRLNSIESNSNQYGRVSVNRIFSEKLEDSIEQLRQLAPVVVRDSLDKISAYPKLEKAQFLDAPSSQEVVTNSTGANEVSSEQQLPPTTSQRIQPSFAQVSRVERTIATFIDESGLSETAMSGDLHMTVQNESFPSLRLDVNEVEGDRSLTFALYAEQSNDAVNRAMTYAISSEGLLKLQNTAFLSPSDPTQAIEGCDHLFAATLARTLVAQKYPEATLVQLQSSGPESGRDDELMPTALVMPQALQLEAPPSEVEKKTADQEPKVSEGTAQPVSEVQLVSASELIQLTIAEHEPLLAEALVETEAESTVEVTVGQLRQWYRAALEQEKPPTVLEAIAEKGKAAKDHGSVTLSSTEASDMRAVLEAPPSEVEKTTADQEPKVSEGTAQPVSEVQLVSASELIQLTIAEHEPLLAKALIETEAESTVEVEVEQLRQWYKAARARQRPLDVLEAIAEKGKAAKDHGPVTLSSTEASDMNTDLIWLSESKPASREMLREWWQANTVIAGANYTAQITAIAQPLKKEGTTEIMLDSTDHKRMLSDVRALRSALTQGTLAIWQELEAQGRIVQTREGRAYKGKEYDFVESSDKNTLTLTNRTTRGGINIKDGSVTGNTLSVADAQRISAVAVDAQSSRVSTHEEVQH